MTNSFQHWSLFPWSVGPEIVNEWFDKYFIQFQVKRWLQVATAVRGTTTHRPRPPVQSWTRTAKRRTAVAATTSSLAITLTTMTTTATTRPSRSARRKWETTKRPQTILRPCRHGRPTWARPRRRWPTHRTPSSTAGWWVNLWEMVRDFSKGT